MKIYCKNVVHKILKNVDVAISGVINLGFFDFIDKDLNYTKIGLP